MSDEQQKIKVDMDTSFAKRQMKTLGKKAAKVSRRVAVSSARRISSSITGVGRLPVFTIGVVGGAIGLSRIIGRGRRGNVDPWSQALSPLKTSIQEFIDKKIGYNAGARMSAVSQTAQKTAINSYFMKETDSAQKYYNVIEPMMQLEYKGLSVVRQAMKGPGFTEVLERAINGYMILIGNAFSYLYDKLKG